MTHSFNFCLEYVQIYIYVYICLCLCLSPSPSPCSLSQFMSSSLFLPLSLSLHSKSEFPSLSQFSRWKLSFRDGNSVFSISVFVSMSKHTCIYTLCMYTNIRTHYSYVVLHNESEKLLIQTNPCTNPWFTLNVACNIYE